MKECVIVKPPRLTMLNSMAGSDIWSAIEYQHELGIRDLELKDGIHGKNVLGLDLEEAGELNSFADARGMSVHCLATSLFGDDVKMGAGVFRRKHAKKVDHLVGLVQVLSPTMVKLSPFRVLGAGAGGTGRLSERRFQWIFDQYREAVEAIIEAGAGLVTIENEPDGVIRSPASVMEFFDELDMSGKVGFTWDIQNMWQTGSRPTVEVYRELRSVVRHVHVKGGRAGSDGSLKWKSTLRDADWPVAEIVGEVGSDSLVDVICLNPPHGETPSDGRIDSLMEDDVRFLVESGLARLVGAGR